MRTSVLSEPGCPSNGSAWTKPVSGVASRHISSSSAPSIVGASTIWTADATGRDPGADGETGDDSLNCARAGEKTAPANTTQETSADIEKYDMAAPEAGFGNSNELMASGRSTSGSFRPRPA